MIVGLVTAAWAANFTAALVVPRYEPDSSINGIFLAVVGGAIALQRPRSGGGGAE